MSEDFQQLIEELRAITDPAKRAEFLREHRELLTGFKPNDAIERGAAPVPDPNMNKVQRRIPTATGTTAGTDNSEESQYTIFS